MKRHVSTISIFAILVGAGVALAMLPARCAPEPDHVENPAARKVYELRGAPFEPVAGAKPVPMPTGGTPVYPRSVPVTP